MNLSLAETTLPREFRERYQLEAELGRGAGGVVLRALDRTLGRAVAIKFLSDAGKPADLARFRREAQLLARIAHPNVVTLFHVDAIGGSPYMVMELVEGGSLRAVMRARGPLPVAEAAALVRGCLDGLAACHAQQVVHRDVKPENVLLSPAGAPKVADLGVGLYLPAATRLTETGGVVGTPRYMAPEQFTGDSSPAADVYSVAAMLHEMLSGRFLFGATNLTELLRQILAEPPPDIRDRAEVPAPLADLLTRALAKNPSQRPPDAATFRAELDAALAPAPLPPCLPASLPPCRPASLPPSRPPDLPTSRPLPAVLAACAVALSALALNPPRPRPPIPLATPTPDAPWSDPAVLPLEAALDALAAQAPRRRARWVAVHRDTRYTLEDLSAIDHPVKMLRAELEGDAKILAGVDEGLRKRTEGRLPSEAERVLLARLRGYQFMTEAPRERLTQYVDRGIDTTGKSFDGLGRLMVDGDTFTGPAVGRLTGYAAAYADALAAAVRAGAAAGARPGPVVAELSVLMYWLNAQSHGVRTMPAIERAGARLRQDLTALAGGQGEPARAARVSLALIDWRRTGLARREDRSRLAGMLSDIRVLAAGLTAAAGPLAAMTAEIDRELAEAGKR